MCGIAGVVAFDRSLAATRQTLAAMSACIAHRGPDGQGDYFCDSPGAHVALTHRRLAILDTDPRSNQPFTDGHRHLVFNGEIYNFRDLRKELGDRPWKTTGDTETLLACYDTWGEKCVDHLNGMYAFAVWDDTHQTLFLARDRMGQKPLYLAIIPGENNQIRAVAFASEISAVLAWPPLDRTTDSHALHDYLRWGYISTPKTIYRQIEQLPPSQTMRIATAGSTRRTYYRPDSTAPSAGDAIHQTRRLVQQAVHRQLISDVPLGCFLSGGIDSSVIAAAMTAAGGKVLTFSIGFDDPRYDETRYAAAVAAHLKTEHRQFTVHPDAAADLPRIAAAFGQPMADSSALPTHYLAMQTRPHVKVALSGDGGDESFGGYDRYRALLLTEKPLPWRLLKALTAVLPGSHPKSFVARMKRLIASAALPPTQRYSAYTRLFDDAALQSLLCDPLPPLPQREFDANLEMIPAALALDRQTYLPDDLLTKVDRCSMMHALEVRCPFMDHDLVNFAAGLNTAQLLRGGPKHLLRKAFCADLPHWVFRREKMGFAVPIGDWLRAGLRPMLHDLLHATDSFAASRFRRRAMDSMIHDHESRRCDHSQRLYALLMLELWHNSIKAGK